MTETVANKQNKMQIVVQLSYVNSCK